MKEKESLILKNQKLLAVIEKIRSTLVDFHNHYKEGHHAYNHDAPLDILSTYFYDGQEYELAQSINDEYLETHLKNAFDNFVAALYEIQKRKQNELNSLLTKTH